VPTNRAGLAPPRRRIDVHNRLVEARAALTDGDLDTAEEKLGSALAGDPEVAETYSLLGRLRLRQGRLDEAEAMFEKGLQLKPDDLAVTLGLATARLRSGRIDTALAVLERTAQRRPTEAWPMVVVASFARQAGRLDAAAEAIDRALELDPESPGAHLEMAVLELGRGAFARAERLASRALELDPRLRGAHLCRAQSLEAQGQLEAARAEYRAERALAPEDHRPVYGLARLEGRLGNSDDERRLLEETIRIEPDFAPAYLYLARSLMIAGGNYRRAISVVDRALEKKPEGSDLALAYYLLADLYNRIGEQGLSNEYAAKGKTVEEQLARERDPLGR
jgi:tetratricopeptide (TPR) repeat protein